MTEDLELHIIEIPKINKMLKSGKLKKWIMFLENPNGEETKKMAEEDEEIKEAIKTLKEISNDEEKERIAELRLKYLLDKKSEERTAREKGLKQGLEEGRKQGLTEGIKKGIKEGIKEGIEQGKEKGKKEKAKEIARKMLEENISLDLILKITGLTKEEIKQNVL